MEAVVFRATTLKDDLFSVEQDPSLLPTRKGQPIAPPEEGRPVPAWLHQWPQVPARSHETVRERLSLSFSTPSRVALSAQLNPQQQEVVLAPPAPTLVLAGAGSGKTHTLIHRVAELVNQGVAPEQILLITFTRKAADEMIHRTQVLLNQSPLKIQGGTFHAMGLTLLKIYGAAIGLHNKFSIMDEDDATGLVHILASKRGFTSRTGFPKKQQLVAVCSRAANMLRPIPDVVATYFPWLEEHTPQLVALYRVYTDTKWQQHRLDYDDLLLLLYKLLCIDAPTRLRLARHYKAILVDEYQDSTQLQAMIVELLASEHQNVMVVGDDAQAIYGFRGSMIDSMRGFLKSFPQAHIFRLEQNYRSTKQILNIANHILEDAKGLIPKRLFTSKEDGSQPELVTCESELAQSQFIATRILELMNQGVSIKDMAVLFRSSSHSFELEACLTKHRLHFVKYGGLQLTETAHVKDVLAYLRVADNPLDAGAWHRLLLLIDRVGAKFAQRLIESMEAHPHPLDVLEQTEGKQQRALTNLAAVIRSVQDETIPLMDRMHLVLHHYEPLLHRDYGTDAEHRMDDLKKLAELAGHNPSLEVFLQDITLDPNQSKDGSRDQKDVHLTLSTIHSAKGLEWKVVFVIWLLDGQFPPVRSWYDEPVLEEERRLFYVAVTRAKDQLTMLYPVEHYHHGAQQILTQPCRFIRSIPQPALTALHAAEVR